MAKRDKFDILKKLLSTNRTRNKVSTERSSYTSQKKVFDTFFKTKSAIYQQSLLGSAERTDQAKDYDQMDSETPEIASALNIYADDCSIHDEDGNVVSIVSDDENIVMELEELLYEIIDVNYNAWPWFRNMCKLGDQFLLYDLQDKEGIVNVIPLPTLEIERLEGMDGDPNSLKFRWMTQGQVEFENYQISHLRLLGDDKFLPYGRSILDSSRKTWKQLTMMEDAMLTYRIVRSPERRVFYIDVGNIPPEDVEQYMQHVRNNMFRTAVMQESNGSPDYQYDPQSILEDFFIPVRGDRGSRIDSLPGGQNSTDIDDVEYIRGKLFTALGVPKSYLQSEEDLSGKATLSQEDIRFARTIQRIQRIFIAEMAKACIIHLFLKGYDEEDIYNFDLKMNNPSTVMEMLQLELIERRFEIASRMADSPLISDTYVQKEILKLSDEEIVDIFQDRVKEARKNFIIESILQGDEIPDSMDDKGSDGGETDTSEEGDDFSDDDGDSPSSAQTESPFSKADLDPLGLNDPHGISNMAGLSAKKETSVDNDGENVKGKVKDKILKLDKDEFLDLISIKSKKKKKDFLDRTISDILRVDSDTKTIIENLKENRNNNNLMTLKEILRKK